jgi:hypothetical protein
VSEVRILPGPLLVDRASKIEPVVASRRPYTLDLLGEDASGDEDLSRAYGTMAITLAISTPEWANVVTMDQA